MRLILYNIQYLQGHTGKKIDYLRFWKRFHHPIDIEKQIAKNKSNTLSNQSRFANLVKEENVQT